MPNEIKKAFLEQLKVKFGSVTALSNSYSLFSIQGSNVRVYIRYSKKHYGRLAWYGLRENDLRQLQGFASVICFLWDDQKEPLLIPYADYEEVFQSAHPADDGQYKAQIIFQNDSTELYIARVGRFNLDGYFGWVELEKLTSNSKEGYIPELDHSQIQTLLGSIATKKKYDVWIPKNDRLKLDWRLTNHFECRECFPSGYERIHDILSEIDVIWLSKGSNQIIALYEVEYSTPIYSGLLRFNDFRLTVPDVKIRFGIVANDIRRSFFIRQINRPTFQNSGLGEICNFLEFANVFNWHRRIVNNEEG